MTGVQTCALPIYYFSDLEGEPIYTVEHVNRCFADSSQREGLIKFLNEVFCVTAAEVGADYFRERIPLEVEERLNYLRTYRGPEKYFFPNALREHADRYYRTQFGMRGIQEVIPFGTIPEHAAFERYYRR